MPDFPPFAGTTDLSPPPGRLICRVQTSREERYDSKDFPLIGAEFARVHLREISALSIQSEGRMRAISARSRMALTAAATRASISLSSPSGAGVS